MAAHEDIEYGDGFKEAEYALLGYGLVDAENCSFNWSRGGPNRSTNKAQLDNLEQLFRATLCRDSRNAIFVTVPGPKLRECLTSCPNLNPAGGPYDPQVIDHHLAASLEKTTPLDLRGVPVGMLRLEVQAGQHRLTALRQLLDKDQVSADSAFTGSSVPRASEDLWWPAFIFDSEKLKYSDLEKLRINGANNSFEDTDGIVWLRVLNIEEQEGSIPASLRRHIFAQTNRERAGNNHAKKPATHSGLLDVWSGRYKEVVRIESTTLGRW